MTTTRESTGAPLVNLQVTTMQVWARNPCHSIVDLDAQGDPDTLNTLRSFINASWLDDLSLPFLTELVNLRDDEYGFVHLREEGWATLADDGRKVHVASRDFSDTYAIVDWHEFQRVVQLKYQFMQLMQHFQGQGIPRYSREEGFRVRLHAPGHLPAATPGR